MLRHEPTRRLGPLVLLVATLLGALGLGGVAASAAVAAELSIATAPRDGAVFGRTTRFAGRLSQDGAPLAGHPVSLEARPAPFGAPFAPVATTTTDANGSYAFRQRFDRNQEARVVAPAQGAASLTVSAFVFPRASTTVRTVGRNRVRITQLLRVPDDVRLTGLTRLYVGRGGAERAPFARAARPKRRKAGVYRARATVRVPARFKGRFSYAACLRVGPASVVGDRGARCPRVSFAFGARQATSGPDIQG